jgi:quercetin dioxygenase-like cupin family protein
VSGIGSMQISLGGGQTRWMSGDVYRIIATGAETGGSLAFGEALVPPGSGPVPHVHPRSDEAFLIVEGELEFLISDDLSVAVAGDFVFVPRGTRHRFRNISDRMARMFFIFTPGGPERLFLEGGDAPTPGGMPTPWPMERFIALSELAAQTGTDVIPDGGP